MVCILPFSQILFVQCLGKYGAKVVVSLRFVALKVVRKVWNGRSRISSSKLDGDPVGVPLLTIIDTSATKQSSASILEADVTGRM